MKIRSQTAFIVTCTTAIVCLFVTVVAVFCYIIWKKNSLKGKNNDTSETHCFNLFCFSNFWNLTTCNCCFSKSVILYLSYVLDEYFLLIVLMQMYHALYWELLFFKNVSEINHTIYGCFKHVFQKKNVFKLYFLMLVQWRFNLTWMFWYKQKRDKKQVPCIRIG